MMALSILNAIIHRDYTSSSDSIVKIFDERIEIYNPGRLPAGLTVDKLLTGDYRSSVRNRKLANMFKEVGLVDKYGSGIRRIVQGFKEYGLPVPKFQEISDGFMVTIFNGDGFKTTGEVTGEVVRLLPFCLLPQSRKQLMEALSFCYSAATPCLNR
jgi:ATP-dependent DNA helicase RecG